MNEKIKKLVVAAMLTAIGFALSGFSFPIGASKCFPIQHLINVVSGVILGPAYSVLVAFCISVLRNLAGTGSLLAFPGSMVGAFLCGMMYKYTKNSPLHISVKFSVQQCWAACSAIRWLRC